MGASLERTEPVRGATWGDFEHVVELLVRQNRAATGVAALREAFVRANWELPSFEVGRDNWICGHTGYAAVSPSGELALVAADDEKADALLELAVARARERELARLELRPLPGDEIHGRLLDRHAFVLQTDLLAMWRALASDEAEPTWPAGIAARTFEAADAAAVHVLLDEAYGGWDSTYVPLGHEDWLRAMTGDVEFDPTVWWLAERNGALAGCALWWSSGWLKDVVVRESERGLGLGAALIRQGFAAFARHGVRRVGLKVDAANPTGAPRLYERLGFTTERREQIWALSL
jgi:ribosomal protein S18 acetylase RimI-like enzyme